MNKIAIIGRPNVGKSSLFNRLCKHQDAITSEVSGTTRDIKKGICIISEKPFILLDTGGLEEKANLELAKNKKDKKNLLKRSELFAKVSQASINIALEADLILYMLDGSKTLDENDKKNIRYLQSKKPLWVLINKIDSDKMKENVWGFSELGIVEMHYISVTHNRYITKLLNEISSYFKEKYKQGIESHHLKDYGNNKNLTSDFANKVYLNVGVMGEDPIERKERNSKAINLCKEEKGLSEEMTTKELESPPNFTYEAPLKVGIIGRINVGKSSLLNALVGSDRSIVSDFAGTTIDPVNDFLTHRHQVIEFIDTAGIRRASKIEGIEKFALKRTNDVLCDSHIALLVLDASSTFVELDEKISALINKHHLGIIIVLNKFDIKYKSYQNILKELKHKFRFLEYAPIVHVSAISGKNIQKLKDKILEIGENFFIYIPTAKLNTCIEQAIKAHHPPSDHGKLTKIYYVTQFEKAPMKIALMMNNVSNLHFSYKRYLVNTIRDTFHLAGVPILLEERKKK